MKQKIVGVYELPHRNVQLVLMEGSGGELYFRPDDDSLPRIKVGADCDFSVAFEVLCHEALECALADLEVRYEPSGWRSNDIRDYCFIVTHVTMTEAVSRMASFVGGSLPDFKKEWKRWQKKGKKE